jgi:HEAT repeat protein
MLWWVILQLRSKDAGTRKEAARRLGQSKDPRAVTPLVRTLMDENSDVRQVAAYWLGESRDARAVPSLLIALKDRDTFVGMEAAEALGKIGDVRAVEPLITALKENDGLRMGAAAEALGEIGDTRAVEPLFEAIHRDYSSDIGKAIRAFHRVAPRLRESVDAKRLVRMFILALNDDNIFVREAADEALDWIDPNWIESDAAKGVNLTPKANALVERIFGVVSLTNPYGEVVRNPYGHEKEEEEIEQLLAMGDVAVQALGAAIMMKRNPYSVDRMASYLGRIGGDKAVQELSNVLAMPDDNTVETMRAYEAAAEALIRIGSSAAHDELTRAESGPAAKYVRAMRRTKDR